MDFAQTLERQRPRLRRLAMTWTRNADEAEDIAQETIVRAFRKRDQFQPQTNLNAWMAVIARNVAINRYRRFHHSNDTLSLDGISETESGAAFVPDHDEHRQPEAMLLMRADEDRIAAAIGRLSPEHQKVLVGAAIEEKPYETLADELRIPIGTVRSRLFRARENLRLQLAG